MEIKFKANPRGFIKSLDKMRSQLPEYLIDGATEAGKAISENMDRRFTQDNPNSKGSKKTAIIKNIQSTEAIYRDGNIIVGIGNIDNLDSATELTTLSGKKYSLWRLLEFGWGMRGGFRDTLYEIRPTGGRKALSFSIGGVTVFAAVVRHPGSAGRHSFLKKSGDWYAEDKDVMIDKLRTKFKQLATKLSIK